jgi:nucleotide-binding universal stress UspA family protein
MKILVPIDGSKYSQAAVDFIASRSTLIGTDPHVELLNVQLPLPPHALRAVGKTAANEYQAGEAAHVLKPAVETLKQAGLDATSLHAVGSPSEVIATRANQINADLVVLGSHGHGALYGLVLGSTVAGVMARSDHPVLVLRGVYAAPPDTMSVGVAVDGSKYGLAAAQYVIDHRELFGATPRITVLNVVPDLVGSMMPSMEGMALPIMSPEEIKAQQD